MQRLLALLLVFSAARLQAAGRPILAHFTTCAHLSSSLYPADTTTWFDPDRNPQVVFYAHMLFPLVPGQEAPGPGWHPPLVWTGPESPGPARGDAHYAEARWLDPDGALLAHYGLTMPARVSADYLRLQEKQYIPHTFAMTVGTKDLRLKAGQISLPQKAGQYHIEFYVNGWLEGIAFFKILNGPEAGAGPPQDGNPRAVTTTSGDPGLNALREMFKALTNTGK